MSENSQPAEPLGAPQETQQQELAVQQQQNPVARLMDMMRLEKQQKKAAKQKYAFWETQPVMQFSEGASSSVSNTAGGSRHTGCSAGQGRLLLVLQKGEGAGAAVLVSVTPSASQLLPHAQGPHSTATLTGDTG